MNNVNGRLHKLNYLTINDLAIIQDDVIALMYGLTTQPTNMKLSHNAVVYGATLLINKKTHIKEY